MTPLVPPAAPPADGVVHAAGALVWRERAERLEVALVHRPRYRDWSWPKGKLDPGESVPAAAVREVEEETGTPVVLGIPLPGLAYRTADGRRKQVRYWAARPATDDDAPALAARPPVTRAGEDEIDDVVWVGSGTAADLLTRPTDRAPLAALVDAWTRGRLATRTVVVVRHGRARSRSAWGRGELSRPLTPQGAAQAAALGPLLGAFGVRRVLTSPWERCLASVLPYTGRAGVDAELVEELTEAAALADPGRVETLTDHLLEEADGTLVCTHRPVLPTVLGRVDEASRRWTVGMVPAKDPWLRPGEALVAHVAARGGRSRVVAVERHRPPASA